MPYNLLLLPLLAGYLFLSLSNLRAYSVLKLGKDQLLLHAAAWGLVLLILSRSICMLLLQTEIGLATAQWLHTVAPFAFIGTALGTLGLTLIGVAISNLIVDEKAAARWLYHKGVHDPLTSILWSSFLGVSQKKPPGPFRFMLRVLWGMLVELRKLEIARINVLELPALIRTLALLRAAGAELSGLPKDNPLPVMLHFKDHKVLVGYVVYIDNNTPTLEFARVAPIWTGHRDQQSNKIVKATDYSAVLSSYSDSPDKELSRVIRISDIAWASLFEESAFDLFAPAERPKPPQQPPALAPAPLPKA